ncbi:MAG: 4Fe-4S binding protein [Elusimicrobiota bacterium]|jgi:2-oxoglutarate ferredoxin oxidoreductase subunit delta|nr:4Fe-4S binding protein [Elusimicrobiota bacterium]
MAKITIRKERCKACELCINACPKHCIALSKEVNKTGYRWAEFTDNNCVGCGFCYQVCPDMCIEVYK